MAKKKTVKKRPAKRKRPKPPLQLLLLAACDSVARDPGTGKPTLYGLFDVVWADSFPASGHFSVFAKIAGSGKYLIVVELVPPAGKALELGEATIQCKKAGHGHIHLAFAGKMFRRSGTYRIRLKSDGQTIGQPISIQVKKRPKK
ncbi:MAG: hypothetical protein CMJ50_03095 [Planctomycetaceae bacterium]|nr:hypothetical protein [Planctomycetaceae bacterium]